MEGEVIAVGAGKREKGELIPLDVKPGDRVLFGKYGGTESSWTARNSSSFVKRKSWPS